MQLSGTTHFLMPGVSLLLELELALAGELAPW